MIFCPTDIPRELIANVSKDDNVSINKHKLNNVRSKSASRYEDKSVEDVALKTASSDSEININSSTPTKLQSDKMFSFRESCRITEKENVILSDSTFKLDEQDIESVDSTFERTSIDYLFDNVSGNVSNDTNKATCNTIVDMNLTSAQNDYDSFDIEYNEFGNLSLLSSTKVYCSIPF